MSSRMATSRLWPWMRSWPSDACINKSSHVFHKPCFVRSQPFLEEEKGHPRPWHRKRITQSYFGPESNWPVISFWPWMELALNQANLLSIFGESSKGQHEPVRKAIKHACVRAYMLCNALLGCGHELDSWPFVGLRMLPNRLHWRFIRYINDSYNSVLLVVSCVLSNINASNHQC